MHEIKTKIKDVILKANNKGRKSKFIQKGWGIGLILIAAIVFNFVFLPLTALAQSAKTADVSWVGQVISWLSGESLLFVSSAISMILGAVFGVVLWLEAQIIDYIISPANFSFTNSPIVTLGWGITRDLANMFFILILLVIAFATVLKIQSYAIKQLWWKVLAAAILINFSLVIAGFVIDFTQVLTTFFLNQITGGGSFGTITTRLAASMQILNFYNPATPASIGQGIGQFASSGIAAVVSIILTLVGLVITVFVFGAAAIFLIVRILYIWFLLIFAPFVWMLWILPATSGQFSKWWDSFLKWTFFAPIYVFMIYLSLSIFDANGKLNTGVFPQGNSAWMTATPGLTKVGMPQAIFQWILVIAMMFGALIVAQKAGAEGAAGARKILTGWGTDTKNWTGRQLRRGYVGATKPEAPTPPPAGAGLRQRLGYRFRQAGAAIGRGALKVPDLREKQLGYATQESAAYKAAYNKYKGLSPAVLDQVTTGILDPRARLAIQQLQIEQDVLKPGANETLNLLDKAHGYGQETEFLKVITEKLGSNGWKPADGFDASMMAKLLNRAEGYSPSLEQNLLKQLAEEKMKKDFTSANGYNDAARVNLLQRSQKYGKEQDFLKLFPNLAPAIGKKINETVAKIENAADIYEDQLVTGVVKELNLDQLRNIARKGGDAKIQKVKDVVKTEFDNLAPAIKDKIQNEILNKTTTVTETDAMGQTTTKQVTITKEMRNNALREIAEQNPDAEKVARAKFTTTSPAWDL